MNALILITILIALALLFSPILRKNNLWRAAITPLASIIGSGFLILGPTLGSAYGYLAPLIMVGLCLLGIAFGSAIRHNIKVRADETGNGTETPQPIEAKLEQVSSLALAFAYIISVAYYLNLFGAFGVRLVNDAPDQAANILTSLILIFILLIGWTKGFKALERSELISVNIKLAVITSLLLALSLYFHQNWAQDQLFKPAPTIEGINALTLALGLIVTVQGFEISRYLGENYTPETRIKSMWLAQLLASLIYIIYIPLVTYSFNFNEINGADETAIITMMGSVASWLPLALIIAALSAQFSAAVADTAGCGGLLNELTQNRISSKTAYVILVICCLTLTWTSDLFEIITYASRAFALYYGIQSALAYLSATRRKAHWANRAYFAGLTLTALAIIIFSTSFESGPTQ